MHLLALLATIFAIPAAFAETSRFTADHEKVVAAAQAALAEEAHVRPDQVARSDEKRGDGKLITKLSAPYSSWPNLAAKAEARVTSGGGESCTKVSVKVSTGNLVWSRHKEFEERVLRLVGVKAGAHKLNDTSPTAEPPQPIPEPKMLEGSK